MFTELQIIFMIAYFSAADTFITICHANLQYLRYMKNKNNIFYSQSAPKFAYINIYIYARVVAPSGMFPILKIVKKI